MEWLAFSALCLCLSFACLFRGLLGLVPTRQVGGLTFFRVGRFGGSFYVVRN